MVVAERMKDILETMAQVKGQPYADALCLAISILHFRDLICAFAPDEMHEMTDKTAVAMCINAYALASIDAGRVEEIVADLATLADAKDRDYTDVINSKS